MIKRSYLFLKIGRWHPIKPVKKFIQFFPPYHYLFIPTKEPTKDNQFSGFVAITRFCETFTHSKACKVHT